MHRFQIPCIRICRDTSVNHRSLPGLDAGQLLRAGDGWSGVEHREQISILESNGADGHDSEQYERQIKERLGFRMIDRLPRQADLPNLITGMSISCSECPNSSPPQYASRAQCIKKDGAWSAFQ
jgi:hypothetical protein